MSRLEALLTDECTLAFTDGTVIKGAKAVSGAILECSKQYTKGYLHGRRIATGQTILAVGVVVIGVAAFGYVSEKIEEKKLRR